MGEKKSESERDRRRREPFSRDWRGTGVISHLGYTAHTPASGVGAATYVENVFDRRNQKL